MPKQNLTKQKHYTVALAGNPNVGKSTVFNALTGMHQHTGNWPGKTVSNAFGTFSYHDALYTLVDLPGTYSLSAHSEEEAHADNFLFSLESDAVAVVCDATCLQRNLHLVLQIAELVPNTIVCVNLMDEAKKKGISIDTKALSKRLHVPVIPMAARSKVGIEEFKATVETLQNTSNASGFSIPYPAYIEALLSPLEAVFSAMPSLPLPPRAIAVQLLKSPAEAEKTLSPFLSKEVLESEAVTAALDAVQKEMQEKHYSTAQIVEGIREATAHTAEALLDGIVQEKKTKAAEFTKRLDRIFMSKTLGIPVMLLLLLTVFWITIFGANYPSDFLSRLLFSAEAPLLHMLTNIGVSPWLREMLVFGLWRVLSWVVAVMLPPMAIFFPMFTLLEDLGYLPRVAFNLDHNFRKSGTCGKQSLTMCMGFGCNAVGEWQAVTHHVYGLWL